MSRTRESMRAKYGGTAATQRLSPSRTTHDSSTTASTTAATATTRAEGEVERPAGEILLPSKLRPLKKPTVGATERMLGRVLGTVQTLEARYMHGIAYRAWMALTFPMRNLMSTSYGIATFLARTACTLVTSLLIMTGVWAAPVLRPLSKEQARQLSSLPPPVTITYAMWAWQCAVRAARFACAAFVVHIAIVTIDVWNSTNLAERIRYSNEYASFCRGAYPDAEHYPLDCVRHTQFASRFFIINVLSTVTVHLLADASALIAVVCSAVGIPLSWCGSGTHCGYMVSFIIDSVVHYIFYLIPLCALAGMIYFVFSMWKEMMTLKIEYINGSNKNSNTGLDSIIQSSSRPYITYDRSGAYGAPAPSYAPPAQSYGPSGPSYGLPAPVATLPLVAPSAASSDTPSYGVYGAGAPSDPVFVHRGPLDFMKNHQPVTSHIVFPPPLPLPVIQSPMPTRTNQVRFLSENQFHITP